MMNQLQKGDCIAYDPNIFGETLTFDDLLKMVGQKVILETEWDDEMELEDIAYAEVVEIVETNGIWIKYDNHSSEIQTMYREEMAHKCRQEYIRAWAIRDPAPETAVVVSAEYTKAVTLTRHIIANAQAMQQSLYEVCKGLKEMRDGKLYKELGYQNFEDYCENEVGIKRHMAYKYIDIANLENVESIQHFGVTKLALLAKLDEADREELTQRVNPQETSVKELKAEIQKLKTEKEQLEDARRSKHQEWLNAMDEITTLTVQKSKLEEQVQELENQEPEPVYIDNPQAEQKFAERLEEVGYEWEQKYDEMEQEKDRQIIALKREQHQKEQEFQQKLKEAKNAGGKKGSELDAYLKMFRDTLSHITALLGNPSMMDFERKQVLSRLQTIYEEYTGAVKDD